MACCEEGNGDHIPSDSCDEHSDSDTKVRHLRDVFRGGKGCLSWYTFIYLEERRNASVDIHLYINKNRIITRNSHTNDLPDSHSNDICLTH